MENRLPDKGAFRRILFCTDFSENADFAFSFAVDAAIQHPDNQLYLLHVVPESEAQFWKTYVYEVEDVDNKAKQDIDEKIRQAYTSRLPQGVDMMVEFKVGKDSQQILKFAEEKQIDLIVMGRQGHGALQKAFFGNVTEKVTRKADCAVLVVPLSYQKKYQQPSS